MDRMPEEVMTTGRKAAAAALMAVTIGALTMAYSTYLQPQRVQAQAFQFHLLEATIDDVHRGIREGQITCRGIVQAYLNRARAYNGVGTKLVTEDIAPDYLPNYSEYKAAVLATAQLPPDDPRKTVPIEFGRMEPTASDPAVQQQFGMVVGIQN